MLKKGETGEESIKVSFPVPSRQGLSFLLSSNKKFLSIRSSILPVEGVGGFLFSNYGAVILLVSFYVSFFLWLAND